LLFPRQQLLRERVLILIYRYVECLVYHSTVPTYWIVGSSAYIVVKTSHKILTGYIPSRRTDLYNAININLPQFSIYTGNSPYRCTRGYKWANISLSLTNVVTCCP